MGEEADKLPKLSDSMANKLRKSRSQMEIKLAIKSLNKTSQGGIDGVTPMLLEELFNLVPCLITDTINEHIFKGQGLEGKLFMKRLIVFLEKPMKTTGVRGVSNYRPVTLAGSLYKLSDAILYRRLKAAFQTEQILPPYIYAYRKDYSLEDPALLLLSMLENSDQLNDKLVF